jgi:hypothetical protein
MNVEIGAEAALFPEKEFINGIAVAVRYCSRKVLLCRPKFLGSDPDPELIEKCYLES